MEKRPEKLKKVAGEQEGQQKINIVMNMINDEYIKTRQPLPYYPVVIDPDNYMYSVDNVFQVAFLANNGLVSLIKGSDGLPEIVPISKDDRTAFEQNNNKEHFIMKLDPALCRKMIDQYCITTPFLLYDRSDNTQAPSQM